MMPGLWGAVCQWHTFSTDRSEYEDTKYGTIRKVSFAPDIICLKNLRRSALSKKVPFSGGPPGRADFFAIAP